MRIKNIIFISILVLTICVARWNSIDIANDFQEELDGNNVNITNISKAFHHEFEGITEEDTYLINNSPFVTPNPNVISYDISTMKYTLEDDDSSISIKYPVISGLNDEIKQKTINELIMAEALKVYNYYDYEDRGHLGLEIEFCVSLASDYVLSIQYYGLGYVEKAAHPHKLFYTTNIDMLTGIRLRLVDLINMDDELINMFINGEFQHVGPLVEVPDLGFYGNYDFAKESFINADNMGSEFSYLTGDSLGISIPVAHAIGGHAEFEIKYKDIAEYLVGDSQGWNKFITNAQK